MLITIKQGSATSPRPDSSGGVIIGSLNNDCNAWGAGFVLALDKLSAIPQAAYRALAKDHGGNIPLGTTQFVEIQKDLWVANMIAQRGIKKSAGNDCLIDYEAFKRCLKTTFERAIQLTCNVHMPAGIGSGLAGGDKSKIHQIIKEMEDDDDMKALKDLSPFIQPQIVLWEFNDPNAASYIPPQKSTTNDSVLDDLISDVNSALGN